MADTLQLVLWALERPCALRRGPDWTDPLTAYRQLTPLASAFEAQRKGDVIDGVAIESCEWIWLGKGEGEAHLPDRGVRVADLFEPAAGPGGEGMVQRTCGPCPANLARATDPAGCVGCFGSLPSAPFGDPWLQEPWDKPTDTAIRRAIAAAGLTDAFAKSFLPTKPVWFGLWAGSPLTMDQCTLLAALFRELARAEPGLKASVAPFRAALEASLERALPLHVKLLPPGHTDLGFHTTFAHCPRCKAAADRERRWNRPNLGGPCTVCGHTGPMEPRRSEEEDFLNGPAKPLEDLVGEAGARDIQRRYLLRQGLSEERIQRVFTRQKAQDAIRTRASDSIDLWRRGPARLARARLAVQLAVARTQEPEELSDGSYRLYAFRFSRRQIVVLPDQTYQLRRGDVVELPFQRLADLLSVPARRLI